MSEDGKKPVWLWIVIAGAWLMALVIGGTLFFFVLWLARNNVRF